MIRAILQFFCYPQDDRWLIANALDEYDTILKVRGREAALAGNITEVHRLADTLRDVSRVQRSFPDLYER